MKILKAEKSALQSGTGNKSSSSALSAPAAAEQLKEKSRLLDEKLKELRRREIEYARMQQQKDRACKEVSALQTELGEARSRKVELAKKLREEADKHSAERKALKAVECQALRREQEATQKAVKATQELSARERVSGTSLFFVIVHLIKFLLLRCCRDIGVERPARGKREGTEETEGNA